MESELEQYLAQVGLSSNMLKSESSSQVDEDTQATSAAVSNGDNDEDEDDDDGAEASEPSEPVADVTVAAVDELVSSTTLFNDDDDDDDGDRADVTVSEVDPAATASPTDDDCRPAADSRTTHADFDTPSEDLVELLALLSPDNNDCVNETSTPQELSFVNDSSVKSCQQQTDTMDCTEVFERVLPQSANTRSTAVLNEVPHHVDGTSTMSSSQILHAPISSSCTIVLGAPTEDVVRRSPTTHRAAEGKQENERSEAEVTAPARRASIDTMLSYTSTIIRCTSSSAPVIATKSSRDTADTPPAKSRDTNTPAAALDDFQPPPPAKPQIKTTPNYVSVVQVGSATAVNERRVIPVTTTTLNDCIASGSVTMHSSPLTGRQHINVTDATGSTPIKSSLKKPGHVKTKSVSFSTGSADDNDDNNNASTTATTTETSNVRQPDAPHTGMAEAVVRLDRDRVDGIAPRRALVSDSGVFCEPEDDVPVLNSEDSKSTTTQPSRRTTVIVSGGMASVKNSPQHHRHEQLADPAATKSTESQSSGAGGRTLNFTSNPDSVRSPKVVGPGHVATTNVVRNIAETKQLSAQDTTLDARRKTSDTCTQVTLVSVISLSLSISC